MKYYDGQQPGACPTMYFRDTTPTIRNLQQYRLWVALQAGSGIVAQHDAELTEAETDAETGADAGANKAGAAVGGQGFWNVTVDPYDEHESPLWAFTKYR